MAIDFPNSPANNDVYTVGNRSWVYSSSLGAWSLQSSLLLGANTVTTTEITNGTIAAVDLGASNPTNGQALLANSSTASGLEWGQAGSPVDDPSAIISVQVFS